MSRNKIESHCKVTHPEMTPYPIGEGSPLKLIQIDDEISEESVQGPISRSGRYSLRKRSQSGHSRTYDGYMTYEYEPDDEPVTPKKRRSLKSQKSSNLKFPDLGCPICVEVFTTKAALKKHCAELHDLTTDESILEYMIKAKCGVSNCNFGSTSEKGVIEHCQEMHPQLKPPYPIERNQLFDKKIEKPFDKLTCPLCNRFYSTRDVLRKHLYDSHSLSVDEVNEKFMYKTMCGVEGCTFTALSAKAITDHCERLHPDLRPPYPIIYNTTMNRPPEVESGQSTGTTNSLDMNSSFVTPAATTLTQMNQKAPVSLTQTFVSPPKPLQPAVKSQQEVTYYDARQQTKYNNWAENTTFTPVTTVTTETTAQMEKHDEVELRCFTSQLLQQLFDNKESVTGASGIATTMYPEQQQQTNMTGQSQASYMPTSVQQNYNFTQGQATSYMSQQQNQPNYMSQQQPQNYMVTANGQSYMIPQGQANVYNQQGQQVVFNTQSSTELNILQQQVPQNVMTLALQSQGNIEPQLSQPQIRAVAVQPPVNGSDNQSQVQAQPSNLSMSQPNNLALSQPQPTNLVMSQAQTGSLHLNQAQASNLSVNQHQPNSLAVNQQNIQTQSMQLSHIHTGSLPLNQGHQSNIHVTAAQPQMSAMGIQSQPSNLSAHQPSQSSLPINQIQPVVNQPQPAINQPQPRTIQGHQVEATNLSIHQPISSELSIGQHLVQPTSIGIGQVQTTTLPVGIQQQLQQQLEKQQLQQQLEKQQLQQQLEKQQLQQQLEKQQLQQQLEKQQLQQQIDQQSQQQQLSLPLSQTQPLPLEQPPPSNMTYSQPQQSIMQVVQTQPSIPTMTQKIESDLSVSVGPTMAAEQALPVLKPEVAYQKHAIHPLPSEIQHPGPPMSPPGITKICNEETSTCIMCMTSFTDKKGLHLHLKQTHSLNEAEIAQNYIYKYKCTISECHYGSLYEGHLKKHLETAHPEQKKQIVGPKLSTIRLNMNFTCTKCRKSFKTLPEFRQHFNQKSNHKKIKLQRLMCLNTILSKASIARVVRRTFRMYFIEDDKLKIYECKKCKRTFQLYSLYRQHAICCRVSEIQNIVDQHLNRKIIKIPFSPMLSITSLPDARAARATAPPIKRNRQRNVVQYGGSKIVCKLCFHTLRNLKHYLQHMLYVHKKNTEDVRQFYMYKFMCEAKGCFYGDNKVKSVEQHIRLVHPFLSHDCPECGHTFHHRAILENHIFNKHVGSGRNKYRCSICGRGHRNLLSKQLHENKKHNIPHSLERVTCVLCEKTFAHKQSLRNHMLTHTTDRPVCCDYCGMRFKSKPTKDMHIKNVHLNHRPYLCDTCGDSFPTKTHLQTHINKKHGEYKYQCEYCAYSSRVKDYLYTHMFAKHKVRHPDHKRKSYSCPQCDFVTLIPSRFQTHMNAHTNTRNYECEICGKRYITSSTLKSHKNWAHGNSTIDCPYCNFPAKSKSKFMEHIRCQHIFQDLKPFSCPYCEFTCATSGNTRKHVMKRHPGLEVRYIKDEQAIEQATRQLSGMFLPLFTNTLNMGNTPNPE